ncbi:hypothetical protein TRVL_09851 [Trypanosoma vivax]|nr:hypothetical protein TRVL_09851 [Trypanosoma vivax]
MKTNDPLRELVSTPFTCCACRRTVSLDGQNVAYSMTHPTFSRGRYSSNNSGRCIPGDPQREEATSTVFWSKIQWSSKSGSMDSCVSAPTTLASDCKAHSKLSRAESYSHENNAATSAKSEDVCSSGVCNEVAQIAERGSAEPHLSKGCHDGAHHPSISGSRATAAGRYGPLLPSPFSPWLSERYGELKCGRFDVCENNRCADGKFVTTSSNTSLQKGTLMGEYSQIASSLPPCYVHQHAWMRDADGNAYTQGLWESFNACGSSPAAPRPQTYPANTHTGLGQSRNEPLASALLRSLMFSSNPVSVSMSSPLTGDLLPLRMDNALGDGSISPSSVNICGNSSDGNRQPGSETAQCEKGQQTMPTSTPITAGAEPSTHSPLSPSLSAKLPPKADSVRSAVVVSGRNCHQDEKLAGVADERKVGVASHSRPSSPVAGPDAAQPHPWPVSKSSRNTFIAQFSQHAMRRVVHLTNTDLPLCLHCWSAALENRQSNAVRIMQDSSILAALTNASVESVTCSVDEQEALERLQVVVLEAEERLLLINTCRQMLNNEVLPHLLSHEELISRRLHEASGALNGNYARTMFETDDALEALQQREQNMINSCAYACSTRGLMLAFPISTRGSVGTVAGLRLGKYNADSAKRNLDAEPVFDPMANTAITTSSQSTQTSVRLTSGSSGGLCVRVPSDGGSTSDFATLFRMTQQQQQCYLRGLLEKRPDVVSVMEINNACGYLLLLLVSLAKRYNIEVRGVVLHPNGEQSKVEIISVRDTTLEVTRHFADFFIKEQFFAWKTFGAACVAVAGYVREMARWMSQELKRLQERAQKSTAAACSGVDARAETVWTPLSTSTPPYVITKDQIDGFPLRHGSVSDEQWTVAMKKLLAVVQWCVLASRDVDELRERLSCVRGDSVC